MAQSQDTFNETTFNLENMTLPSQLLDESSPELFNSRPVPFSPTSPGKRSPGRPKTMKEYEEDIVNLKRENFNLKVRIYFMEQNRFDPNIPKDVDELRNSYTDLKIEHELQKKDLASKEDLLLNTYRALDAQKQQIESMKNERDIKTQELEAQIEGLEKELKEYQIKFMETSVQLDDTNAIYAITFGLGGNKPETNKPENDNLLEKKIKELESCLETEKEQVLRLEETISELNCKHESDQTDLHSLHNKLLGLENDLKQALKEKYIHEESLKDRVVQTKKLLKNMKKCQDAVFQKETEIDSLKKLLHDFEQKMCLSKSKLHEKEEAISKSHATNLELRDNMQKLIEENNNLLAKIKLLEQQLKLRSPSRDHSSGHRSSDQEDKSRHQRRVREYQKELQSGSRSNTKTLYPEGVENFIQTLVKDNGVLKKEVEKLKGKLSSLHCREGSCNSSAKEEVAHNLDVLTKEMATEKDNLISELRSKIEELKEVVNVKECKLEELSSQISEKSLLQDNADLKTLIENFSSCENEKEALSKELEEKNKEVESLTKELKKKTYNLQGLVNTELWNKNREIEKLNKLCERKHLEILALQKQLRERSLLLQDKVNSFGSPVNLPSGIFAEVKENLQPLSDTTALLQNWTEEKRVLVRKVEELQARLLNTPERDTESQLIQTLRAEKDEAEKQRKEAMNACVLLTTRLQELADFLDSLLPSLCGKKRRVVQQAVERSRELSRSLSLAAEESTLQNVSCSAWTDLQPSLYLPLLPDISTVDFWSGEESHGLSGAEDNPHDKPQTEEPKLTDLNKLQLEKNNEKSFLKSVFDFDQHLREIIVNDALIEETAMPCNIGEFTEGSLMDTCGELDNMEDSKSSKISLEAKSANIGLITLTSRKKDTNKSLPITPTIDGIVRLKDKDGDLSENEAWSEPDRDVSYARMGIKEESNNAKSLQFNLNDTSETVDSAPKSPSTRKASEIQRLQRKMRSLEQVNEALRSELVILHKLAPPSHGRQDKATSIEVSRQSALCVPSHLLEEIKNQREKLEASLFHNDYIRRQLENTVSSIRRSQGGDDQEKATIVLRLKEVTSQLELAECELSKLRLEKENWARKVDSLQTSLEQTSTELVDKKCALIDLERKTTQRLKEEEEKFIERCSRTEQRCVELEQKWTDLQRERDELLEKIADNKVQIAKLKSEVQHFELEGKKNKQLQEELNVKVQQIFTQKDDLQRVVSEQEQLLADAERERTELATQLIARDRQVSELQARLGRVELTSSELEAALRAQLDLATQQCDQYEARIRDLDNSTKREEGAVAELRSRLDAARFAHSEAVLQYTRVANENIRLQQELRRRQHEPHVEAIRGELERRVAELEAVNSELQSKLSSLDMKPPYSDYETDGGSSTVGSPRRPPLPLTITPLHFQGVAGSGVVGSPPLALSPHHYVAQRSQDLTSDYLSDQEAALSSPQPQTRNMWFPSSSHSQASASPDLGIESDHGRFSSLETQTTKSTAISLRGTPVKDLVKLEEENTQLRRNLQKTRHVLEETLCQLTSANQHKRQYEAQLSAANQKKALVERAICRQITKTQSILKKAKVNLEDDWSNKNQ